ncbi:MAG: HD domain-containing protein [Candidatus Sulfotelmatobacter sp.]
MVFPGATHTRFEHCVGAVHVAQLIVDHANENCLNTEDEGKRWRMTSISEPMARFIRLGALLHDIGHLPFGHTLEDELNHLRSHDGPGRLYRVARIPYPNHEVDRAIIPPDKKPAGGWTLKDLVSKLYEPHARQLGVAGFDAFTVLSHIVCKPPKTESELTAWNQTADQLKAHFELKVCQDIVGNTICADFLDYLYRDWYHLGKPLYFDKRIYQYMEVRCPAVTQGGDGAAQFVINVRSAERIRHDALTDILELLNARYKLAETVLFHRAKLALTGLLDRCLLETSDLYTKASLPDDRLQEVAEALLLEASDDGLPLLLKELAEGGDTDGKAAIKIVTENEIQNFQAAAAPQASFDEGRTRGPIGSQQDTVLQLIERLRDREVYCLTYKLRMADLTGPRNPKNTRLRELLDIYKKPANRLKFLRMMELLCDLPRGSLIMNCPTDAAMNAKVAMVNLFVEDEVSPFATYEEQGEPNLTHGALHAQIERFYELWAASIYVDRRVWDDLSPGEKKNLRSALKGFFLLAPGDDPNVIRDQMEPSIQTMRKRASRSAASNPDEAAYKGSIFPSGVPFDKPSGR